MTILIADDDADIRRLVRRILVSELGAEVREAADGLGALEELESDDIDLVILDIQMGVIDGPDTLEVIRNSEAFAKLPVVMISGAADESNVRRLKGLAVDGFIAKPISLAVLRERLIPLIRQLVRPRTDAALNQKLVLQASSRVLVVGADQAHEELISTHLGPLCEVKVVTQVSAALRETLATRPDLVFLSGADAVLPPAVFARTVRRDSSLATRLVLCASAGSDPSDESALFDGVWTGGATFDRFLEVLGPHLADATMARLVLGTASPEVAVAVDLTRAAAGGVTLAAHLRWEPPLAMHWPAGSVASSSLLYVDDHAWRITLLASSPFAIDLAGRQDHRQSDMVTTEAATAALHRLTAQVSAQLVRALEARGLPATAGEAGTRTGSCWEGKRRTTPDALEWWVVADEHDTVLLAGQLAAQW